uniref:Uncharacterized protein n=1 Tax=Alexandrium monilatum TaxID=311494 RepID=A0A7S4S241_9DINO
MAQVRHGPYGSLLPSPAHPPSMALAVFSQLHLDLLELLSRESGRPLQGLAQGARALRGRLSKKTQRQLRELEVAYGYIRHLTEQRAKHFYTSVLSELAPQKSFENFEETGSDANTDPRAQLTAMTDKCNVLVRNATGAVSQTCGSKARAPGDDPPVLEDPLGDVVRDEEGEGESGQEGEDEGEPVADARGDACDSQPPTEEFFSSLAVTLQDGRFQAAFASVFQGVGMTAATGPVPLDPPLYTSESAYTARMQETVARRHEIFSASCVAEFTESELDEMEEFDGEIVMLDCGVVSCD